MLQKETFSLPQYTLLQFINFLELKLKYLQSTIFGISRVIYSVANHSIQIQLSSSLNRGSKIHMQRKNSKEYSEQLYSMAPFHLCQNAVNS